MNRHARRCKYERRTETGKTATSGFRLSGRPVVTVYMPVSPRYPYDDDNNNYTLALVLFVVPDDRSAIVTLGIRPTARGAMLTTRLSGRARPRTCAITVVARFFSVVTRTRTLQNGVGGTSSRQRRTVCFSRVRFASSTKNLDGMFLPIPVVR